MRHRTKPAPVHAGLTMEQAPAHFDASMAEEEEPAPAPMSTFRQAQEEHRYNLFLLKQHRLAKAKSMASAQAMRPWPPWQRQTQTSLRSSGRSTRPRMLKVPLAMQRWQIQTRTNCAPYTPA